MEVTQLDNLFEQTNKERTDDTLSRQPFRFKSELSQESFEKLLTWLAPVREDAGAKYEEIRHTLIKIFTYRGCPIAEELADETINRVAAKVEQISKDYVGEPHRYFYGVANKVHLEYLNRPKIKEPPPSENKNKEQMFQCLDSCLDRLTSRNRELALNYYGDEKSTKIETRKTLAESLGVSQNALRIRLYEIRTTLRRCVETCLENDVTK